MIEGRDSKGRFVKGRTRNAFPLEIEERRRQKVKQAMQNPETRHKLSLSKMGDKNPSKRPEVRKKISDTLTGQIPSVECRRKRSIAMKGRSTVWLTGRKRSEETKKKISENAKTNPNFGMKGKIVSIEKRLNHSKLMKERYDGGLLYKSIGAKREQNLSWKGGIAFEPYTPDFNKYFKGAIKERDGYTCMLCNMHLEDLHLLKRRLCIHHIDYDKKNSFPQNCCCLCNVCNSKVNANRKQWQAFFHSLLMERYNYKYTEDQKIILDFTK